MLLDLVPHDGVPLYLQLIRQIRYQIAVSRLLPGEQLPSVRKLSEQLVVNPNTVVRAYRELELEGVLVTRPGAGVYVSEAAPQLSRREQHARLASEVDALLIHARDLVVPLDELLQLLKSRHRQLPAAPPATGLTVNGHPPDQPDG